MTPSIETALADLTAPRAATSPVWSTALSASRRRRPMRLYIPLAAAACMVVAGTIMLPRRSFPQVETAPSTAAAPELHTPGVLEPAFKTSGLRAYLQDQAITKYPDKSIPAGKAPADAPRQIARKASIDIMTPDVRAVHAKAALIVTEGLGEFIESATLNGEGVGLNSTLRLRVRQERLDTVVAQLRELGKVTSESADGVDMTDRMIDLDATIRNEQRVEKELLELLDSRKDAPLGDVLAVRRSLAEVREKIEKLQAQREQTARSVSLATVLVIIRLDAAPAQVAAQKGFGEYFAERVSGAWDQGVRGLVDTLAAIVRSIVGWLPGWIVVVTALAIIWRYVRWLMTRAISEPAPRL